MKKLLFFFCFAFLDIHSFAQNEILVIRNVSIVDVRDSQILKEQIVVIKGNKITAVGKKPAVPKGATVIDAKGKYLVPGLWDMHVHALTDNRYQWVFPLLVANGVTGVREMGHNLRTEDAARIWKDVLDGKMIGPRLVATTASILDGPGTKLNVAVPVSTEEEARQWVRTYKQQGVDFIKPYNLLSKSVYMAMADECKKLDIPFAGHVPFSVTATEASNLGQRSIEHHTDILLSCSSHEAEIRADLLDSLKKQPAGMVPSIEIRAAASYDGEKAKKLFARFVANNTWLCPTLVLNSRTVQTAAQRDSSSAMAYVSPSMQARWRAQMNAMLQRVPASEDRQLRMQMRQKVTGEMYRQGVHLLVGTDTPNPYTVPGFSLHEELEWLVQAGMSPAAVLKAATLDAARFAGKEKQNGTVETGKLADLLLLDANPLENISNTTKIFAVIINGKLLQRSELDKLLMEAKTK